MLLFIPIPIIIISDEIRACYNTNTNDDTNTNTDVDDDDDDSNNKCNVIVIFYCKFHNNIKNHNGLLENTRTEQQI